jgi:hypothetical protein
MEIVPCAVLVVGAPASGKTSVARSLAARFERGAFIEGDLLWKMVVSGASDMSDVLRPRPEIIEQRERQRGTDAYRAWVPPGGSLLETIVRFDSWVGEIPPIGVWVDSSNLTVDETVDEVLSRWAQAIVP